MKWIKIICAFLIVFIGMCITGFFGSMCISAISEVFSYLFTHCSDLMRYTMFFAFGLVGVVIGWGIFWVGANKLKK